MPFAFIIVGLLMTVTAAQGTNVQMARQVATDAQSFVKFGVAIALVGSAGYVSDLQTLSRTFMALIIIALIISNSKAGTGLFGNLQNAINQISGGTLSTTTTQAVAP